MLFKLPAGGMGSFVLADVGGPVRVTDLGNRIGRNPQKYWVAYGTKKTSVSLSDPHLTFYLTHVLTFYRAFYLTFTLTCILTLHAYITLHDIT